jgi:hypothetical protein
MAEAFADLARLIADTPGLRWKVWTENEATGESGGIYLFDDEASARAYLDEHTRRLEGFGITGIRARIFDVNEPLTAITRGPLS